MFAKALELAVGSGPGEGGDTLVAPPSKEMAGLHPGLGQHRTGLLGLQTRLLAV